MAGEGKQQVPPLRFAPVGMTILLQGQVFVAEALAVQQICQLDRSEAWWRDLLFLSGPAH
jgi:hypothetical protein